LEFTQDNNIPESKFDDDDILVFYPELLEEFQKIVANLELYKVPISNLKILIGKKTESVLKIVTITRLLFLTSELQNKKPPHY
jgi:hypothetical protein